MGSEILFCADANWTDFTVYNCRVGASQPSHTTGMIFLRIYMYIHVCLSPALHIPCFKCFYVTLNLHRCMDAIFHNVKYNFLK